MSLILSGSSALPFQANAVWIGGLVTGSNGAYHRIPIHGTDVLPGGAKPGDETALRSSFTGSTLIASLNQLADDSAGQDPGGANTNMQYNNNGSFGGLSTFTTDGTDVTITSDNQLNFRDATEFIKSDADGYLHAEGATGVNLAVNETDVLQVAAAEVAVVGALNNTTGVDLATISGITTIGSTTAATISAAGLLTINNATDASNKTTAGAVLDGGIAVAKKAHIGTGLTVDAGGATITAGGVTVTAGGIEVDAGAVNIDDTTAATSKSTGALKVAGGISSQLKMHAGTGFTVDEGGATITAGGVTVTAGGIEVDAGAVNIDDTTAATSKSTGALKVAGGLSAQLKGHFGTGLTVDAGGVTVTAGGVDVTAGRVTLDDATEATSTTDGSLQTDGGLSVAKDVIAGNDVKLLTDSAVLSLGVDSDATFTHDGTSGLTIAAAPISVDSTGELHLNSTTGDIKLQDDGTDQITFDLDGTAGEVIMKPAVDADDLVFSQFDGTECIRIEDNADIDFAGGYGSTGGTITAAGALSIDGAFVSDSTITGASGSFGGVGATTVGASGIASLDGGINVADAMTVNAGGVLVAASLSDGTATITNGVGTSFTALTASNITNNLITITAATIAGAVEVLASSGSAMTIGSKDFADGATALAIYGASASNGSTFSLSDSVSNAVYGDFAVQAGAWNFHGNPVTDFTATNYGTWRQHQPALRVSASINAARAQALTGSFDSIPYMLLQGMDGSGNIVDYHMQISGGILKVTEQ